MTNQLQGEILFAGWPGGATDTDWAYTPWMPVRGDYATFGVEVLVLSSIATFKWEVQTRTAEDPASIASLMTVRSITSATIDVALNTTACKQLVRYRFNTDATAANTSKYVIFRALQPSWQADR